jgi:large subunit ribosomal protein L19
MDYINLIENKFLKEQFQNQDKKLNIGDIVRIGYLIPEGEKERIQYYEGLIISKKNNGLSKTFTLRRSVQGIGVEQVFLVNSPKIVSLSTKQSSKIRRAKLYFIRNLKGKSSKLKQKF